MTVIPALTGLSAVIDRYDGVILDLWGVIHNGTEPYPGAEDCLDRLRAAGKAVCLLSNAPRRTGGVIAKLAGMGIGRGRYDHIMTSGEAAYEAIAAREAPWTPAMGRTLFHIGPERDQDVYLGLDLTIVSDPERADVVLNTGINDFSETLADYEAVLARCHAARLPMICANPDLVVIVGDRMVICAGTLAARYEEMGGSVVSHGKPYPSVYARCRHLMGDIPASRILAVGDSLRTDVAGANAAGIDVALVTGGIHREELGAAWGEPVDAGRLADAVAASGHTPTWVVPRMVW